MRVLDGNAAYDDLRRMYGEGKFDLKPLHIDRNANAIGLSLTSQLVIDCIFSYAADQGWKARLSQKTIASYCHTTERTAGEYLRYLRDEGVFLTAEFRTGSGVVCIEYDVRPLLAFNLTLGEVKEGTPLPRLVSKSFAEWRDAKRAVSRTNMRRQPGARPATAAPASSAAPAPASLDAPGLGTDARLQAAQTRA